MKERPFRRVEGTRILLSCLHLNICAQLLSQTKCTSWRMSLLHNVIEIHFPSWYYGIGRVLPARQRRPDELGVFEANYYIKSDKGG